MSLRRVAPHWARARLRKGSEAEETRQPPYAPTGPTELLVGRTGVPGGDRPHIALPQTSGPFLDEYQIDRHQTVLRRALRLLDSPGQTAPKPTLR